MYQFKIDYSIHNIKRATGLQNDDIAGLMHMPKNHVVRSRNNFGAAPVDSIHNLAKALNIDFTSLIQGKIDFDALKHHFSGDLKYIPKRYNTYKESRVLTINNVLNFLPEQTKNEILLKFQIPKQILSENSNQICGTLLMDIFIEMAKRHYTPESFRQVGLVCANAYKEIFLKNSGISAGDSLCSLYEKAIHKIDCHIEKNLSYKIKTARSNRVCFSVLTRESTQDALKVLHFGAPGHCYNIIGWAQGISKYIFKSLPQVKKLSCIHDGGQKCLYEIDCSHQH